MKNFIAILLIMSSISTSAQHGKATTIKKTFSRTTSISTDIKAEASTIWALLTNASEFANWNSTVISLEGSIASKGKIRLVSTLDPKRTFKLKVKEMVENEKLVWGDAMGARTYTLSPSSNGTVFSMTEKIGGPMFPLFAKMIPPFDESFEQFAADLKQAAEGK